MDFHGLQGDILPHYSLHHRLDGNLCSGTWSTSCHSFGTDLGVCKTIPLKYSQPSLSTAVQIFFSNTLLRSHAHCCRWAEPQLEVGNAYSQLPEALSDTWEASSHKKHPPHYQNTAIQTQYTILDRISKIS